jgi:hypothetical protein
VNPYSPRAPIPASTPGQAVTASVICSLAVVMNRLYKFK